MNPASTMSSASSASSASAARSGTGIQIRGLTRHYGESVALEPLELRIESGCVTGLLGPNGSGKTTLLRMLAGIVPPTAGSASVGTAELVGDGLAVRRQATYLAGEVAVYGELRASQHLDWFLRGRARDARRRARQIASELGLPLNKRLRSFSHGMKRQLCFAAALAPDVPVRLLDEASEGLDPSKRSQMLELLVEDARHGRTVLLSSHHLGEVERVCDELVFLHHGKLLATEQAVKVRERAARLIGLAWPAGTDLPPIADSLRSLATVEGVEPRSKGFTLRLSASDPRGLLGALSKRTDIPAPSSIEYGRLSLGELYLDLYGVEGT